MEQKRTLPLEENSNGDLAYPSSLSRPLLTELADLIVHRIINTTRECRDWMDRTFDNADQYTVRHGLVDRIRNTALEKGKKTLSMGRTLEVIDRVEAARLQREERYRQRAGEREDCSAKLGVSIEEELPQLHDFLAHGDWAGADQGQFADALAAHLASLYGCHPDAFARIADLLDQRTKEVLQAYERGTIALEMAFGILNCIAQSEGIDFVTAQVNGIALKDLACRRGQKRELSQLQTFALATSQHVPAWKRQPQTM